MVGSCALISGVLLYGEDLYLHRAAAAGYVVYRHTSNHVPRVSDRGHGKPLLCLWTSTDQTSTNVLHGQEFNRERNPRPFPLRHAGLQWPHALQHFPAFIFSRFMWLIVQVAGSHFSLALGSAASPVFH